ncbi:hypothetical protein ACYSNR_00500 [Enterococcus sp. LJL128]|uniref:hypothetical protein n=1 Tax=Enterococcus sp. LJL51 TaxID=3416656 RepID=UPI003CF38265
MVDVKTSSGGWEKMRSGLGNLIGTGWFAGDGVFDDLKDINKYMEEAEEKIREKDVDGVISFSHTSKKSKLNDLFDKLDVLHTYSGKAHDLVDEHIDDPFHVDIDSYVEAMEALSINNYSTDNTIGSTEIVVTTKDGYNFETSTKKKDSITADDLFAEDTVLGKQLKADFDKYKVNYTGDKDDMIDNYSDFRTASLNTGAFDYKSIKDQQMEKEMWVNLGLAAVTLVVGLVCPPAGAVLGIALASAELGSALTGKDWISGRELDTGERWTRGALSVVSIAFDVSALRSFSKATQQANAMKYAFKGGASKLEHLSDMTLAAKNMAKTRITNFKNALTSIPAKLKNGYNTVKTNVKSATNYVKNKVSNFSRVSNADETVKYYRVQGGGSGGKTSQYRIKVNADGTISIPNKTADLNVSAYDLEHAQYFRDTARPGGEIVEFQVPKELDDIIKENMVDQYGYKTNPKNQGGMAPKLVDPTTPGVSYELPSDPWIEWLEEYAHSAKILE